MSETIQATQSKEAKVLIVTSVSAEKEAIEKGLNGASGFDVVVSGVGQAAAASATASALVSKTYKCVINAGIAGGFEGRADLGSIVLSNRIVAADLGAESKEGFLSIESLKLGVSSIDADHDSVLNMETAAQKVGLSVSKGAILTLSTVTGTSETADELRTRIPDAIAEGMEGFGVAEAARQHQVPVIEVRSISNKVGPRDRESWRIKEALAALERISSIFPEVFTWK